MAAWPALFVAPLVALGQLSLAYAMVAPACARGDATALHLVAAACVLVTVVLTAMAWRVWRGRHGVTAADAPVAAERPQFFGMVATLVGALSVLVCAALWLPVWLLSPCA